MSLDTAAFAAAALLTLTAIGLGVFAAVLLWADSAR